MISDVSPHWVKIRLSVREPYEVRHRTTDERPGGQVWAACLSSARDLKRLKARIWGLVRDLPGNCSPDLAHALRHHLAKTAGWSESVLNFFAKRPWCSASVTVQCSTESQPPEQELLTPAGTVHDRFSEMVVHRESQSHPSLALGTRHPKRDGSAEAAGNDPAKDGQCKIGTHKLL